MRKDVKLGFAIGGVLLAVLIVYVLVVPGGASSKNKSAQTTPAGDGKVALEPATPPGFATTPPATPPPAPAEALTGPVASADAKSGDVTPAVDPFEPAKPAASSEVAQVDPAVPADSKSKDLDWNKILNDQPVLMTQTPVASGSVRGTTPATPAIDTKTESKTGSVEPSALASNIIEPGPTPMPSLSPTPAVPAATDTATVTPPVAPATGGTPAVTSLTQLAPVPPASARTHVIRQGETLSSISAAAYGSSNYYPAILKANPGIDPTHLKTGVTINLPDIASSKTSQSSPTSSTDAAHAPAKLAVAIDATKQYRVQAGDSLHKISMRLYGTINNADKIYELNKQTIGADPHRLKVGQVLQLPTPPTAQAQAAVPTDSSK